MEHPLFNDRQREALQKLVEQAAARARAESATEQAFRAGLENAEREYAEDQQRIHAAYQAAQAAADACIVDSRQRLIAAADDETAAANLDYANAKHRAGGKYTVDKEKVDADFKEARWTISAVYDADKKVAKEQLARDKQTIQATLSRLETIHQEAFRLLMTWKMADLAPLSVAPRSYGDDALFAALRQCGDTAERQFQALRGLAAPRFLQGQRFLLLMAALWALMTLPAVFFDFWYYWVAGSTSIAAVAGVLAHAFLLQKGRNQVSALIGPLCQAHGDAKVLAKRCAVVAKVGYREARLLSRKKNQETLRETAARFRAMLQELVERRERTLQEADEHYPAKLREITERRDAELAKAEEWYHRQKAEAVARRENDLESAAQQFARRRDDTNRRHAHDWAALADAWKHTCEEVQAVVGDVDRTCRGLFPPWESAAWRNWQLPADTPSGVRFGALDLDLARVPFAVPRDPHLPKLNLAGLTFPALLPFPRRAALLLEAQDDGRAAAVDALRALTLRFLTALPPGKVRFTILDPVGRGESFAAFMHLADHDEQLVTSRIWTEPAHIEQRLFDLTVHMENVIQKYLRNEFETLEAYNAVAGEVAEPYRVLVVADFPVNFGLEAARRLVSLAASGARCGIYPLIFVDVRQPLPQNFDLRDLEQVCLNLVWHDGRFAWRDQDFGRFELTLDHPPDADLATRLIQWIGREAKLRSRVEVPFESVAPPHDAWWTGDTRGGIAVPLGRMGATHRQILQLGQGTAQHVLVAGKTGSGKSTLMHALITQLALNYSPDEIELYLVDFKKGVEFRTYAAHELPHARVVAVESEREFGLSVLQRLDAELRTRGERFREAGVTDIHAFRDLKGPDCPMPRIMLIVDEFQEFFVEDDKIAQEAALLLDRLVRQGRAFGMHVLLGSQTLGGAYSLARSTIDQMAIRIALQCSENDAQLILSKDNAAARLLSRPGEAIYNSASGGMEGNNIFQVVWLDEARRDDYLHRLHEMALKRNHAAMRRPIVFEGMAPAELPKNQALQRLLDDGAPPEPQVLEAWLGDAIAIKDPTAAVFRRQSGANLLLVGQQPETAFPMMAAALIGLAAQTAPETGPQLYLVMGSPVEGGDEHVLRRLPEVLPAHLRIVSLRELPKILATLTDDLDRRQNGPDHPAPACLFLFGLQRMRDLRREDNFGFGKREDKATPSQLFAQLLRDGPPLGVFTVAWCDNLNNLGRVLDRQMMREFEMRVLFQMSPADSSNLIDAPAAAKLGLHRALYYTDDLGRMEKFRPYGLPPLDWLAWVQEKLARTQVGSRE